MRSPLAAAALKYADAGVSVFPCEPRGKRPMGNLAPRGYLDATTDMDRILDWWGQVPEANVGIPCQPNGLLVFDVDPRNGGSLSALAGVPPGAHVITGSGGHHVYVRHPGGRLRGQLAQGVDLKSAGYVLAPPSIHESGGSYRWDDGWVDTAPELPQRVVLRLAEQDGPKEPLAETLTEGMRGDELARLAGLLRRFGLTPEEMMPSLLEVDKRCKPPYGAAALLQMARGMLRYPPEIGGTAAPDALELETWDEFRQASNEEMGFLVEGIWPEGAFGFIAGPPKSRKTWIALHMAICIATGQPMIGEFPVPARRPVLYVALEGHRNALKHRIGALSWGVGKNPDLDLGNLHLAYKPRGIDLLDPAWADALAQTVTKVGAAIVFVDVMRAAVMWKDGGSENSAADVLKLRNNLQPVMDAGAAIAMLHHAGKASETNAMRHPAERMSGSGALRGFADVGLYFEHKHGQPDSLLAFEARDVDVPDSFKFRLAGEGSGVHGGFRYMDDCKIVRVVDEDLTSAPTFGTLGPGPRKTSKRKDLD